jgi:hypothetical protein
MVEGDYNDVELTMEGSMTLLKPMLQRRNVVDIKAPQAIDAAEAGSSH